MQNQQSFAVEGELGKLVRDFDWSSTPLGSIDQWPQTLRTSVSIMLCSQHPMWIGWGPDLIFLYNDAYLSILGASKHPWALGKPAKIVWAEIWDRVGPMAQAVVLNSESYFLANVRLFMKHVGYLKECYYSFSYSPIRDENNQVIGLFCPSTSTTDQTLSERGLRTLGELSSKALIEKTLETACRSAIDILSHNLDDIPFAILYLIDKEYQVARIQNSYGFTHEYSHINPSVYSLNSSASSSILWPIEEVCNSVKCAIIDVGDVPEIPFGLENQKIEKVFVQPLTISGVDSPLGVLITGVNPCRSLDRDFQTFFELVASQISASLQNAKSVEDEKQRLETLAEVDRLKTLFFSNVSHEFRTPLSLILSPIEEILSDFDNPISSEQRVRLELVHRNALRLLKLVNSLLDFSRIEAKRMQAVYEPTDLSSLTADLASVFRSTMERANLEYIVDTPPLSEPVYVDKEMWEKIIFNLISNAFKFTLEGSVSVKLYQVGKFIELQVKDTGVGIPEEELPRLFERFRRVESTRGRSYEGTGIGLALVQELVKLHGGTISIVSKLGVGSTFTISIPAGKDHLSLEQISSTRESYQPGRVGSAFVAEAARWLPDNIYPPSPMIESSKSDTPESSYDAIPDCGLVSIHAKILLADDNADMRQYVRSLLEKEYFCSEIIAVEDGEIALQYALHHSPDIILSDVMMPKLDGFGLLKALRDDARTQAIPIILLSARAGEEAKIQGLQAGADDYLVKPFSAKELVTRVEAHLKITQIRRAAFQREKELLIAAQSAKNDLELVLRNLKDGFLVLNHNYEVTYLNQELVYIMGRDKDQLLGKNFFDLFPQAAGTQFEEELRTSMVEKIPIVTETLTLVEGKWFESRISPHPEGICIFSTDISLRKQLEIEKQQAIDLANEHQQQRIQEADDYRRKQAEFIDTLCHELRNPLNGIYGGVSLIESDLKEMIRQLNNISATNEPNVRSVNQFRAVLQKLTDTVTAVDQCAKQQKVIVDDVLDLSKLDNNKVELNPVPFHPTDVVKSVVKMFHPQLSQKNLNLITNFEDTPYLKADPHRLRQIVTNLVSNAIKFTGDGGSIKLVTCLESISNTEAMLRVIISDTGIGMDQEEKLKLFDRFAQANRKTSTEFGGSGLGLAISKTLIEAMGGSISVSSEKGKGSEFVFTIKCGIVANEEKEKFLAEATDTLRSRSEEESYHQEREIHILIVEDNKLNQKIICRFMEQKGYQFSLANNGQEALDMCSHTNFDLIFMDVEMPVINGIQATVQIREIELAKGVKKPVPIIGISGNVSEKQVKTGLDAGMNAYLKKPYERAEVFRMINHFCFGQD